MLLINFVYLSEFLIKRGGGECENWEEVEEWGVSIKKKMDSKK